MRGAADDLDGGDDPEDVARWLREQADDFSERWSDGREVVQTCPRCEGNGVVEDGLPCGLCAGDGYVGLDKAESYPEEYDHVE